jgi:anti-sigma regulatory factor (Ser/Thr protein kinase)
LWEWHQAELGDDAGLVVSELVTNAVTASRELLPRSVSPVRLWLASDTELVLVLVGDANPRPPLRVDAGLEQQVGLVSRAGGRDGQGRLG